MIYPNIQVITSKDNVYFADFLKSFQRTDNYEFLKSYYNLDNNTAIIVLSQISLKYKDAIKFIKKKNISNVYFFIDDCFRHNLGNSFINTENKYQEINIVKAIIKKAKIKYYRIFHCEMVDSQVNGLNLEYGDLFLTNYVKCNKILQNKHFDFKYKVSCLNNRCDIHRQLISAFLCKKEDVFLTLNEQISRIDVLQNLLIDLKKLNQNLKTDIFGNLLYLNNNKKQFLDPKNKKSKSILSPNRQHSQFVFNIIQDSFANIVTETNFTSNNFFITEKTIKPIACFRPFIIVGVPGTLRQLKEFGFKTFCDWWNESYDEETDHTIRLKKIFALIEYILSKSNTELYQMLYEMSEVLDYNYNNLKNLEEFLLPAIK